MKLDLLNFKKIIYIIFIKILTIISFYGFLFNTWIINNINIFKIWNIPVYSDLLWYFFLKKNQKYLYELLY